MSGLAAPQLDVAWSGGNDPQACWHNVLQAHDQVTGGNRATQIVFIGPNQWTASVAAQWTRACDQANSPNSPAEPQRRGEDRVMLRGFPRRLPCPIVLPLHWCARHLWLVAPPLVAHQPYGLEGPVTSALLGLARALSERANVSLLQAQALASALLSTCISVTFLFPLQALALPRQPPFLHPLPRPGILRLRVTGPQPPQLFAWDHDVLHRVGLQFLGAKIERLRVTSSRSALSFPQADTQWQAYERARERRDPSRTREPSPPTAPFEAWLQGRCPITLRTSSVVRPELNS